MILAEKNVGHLRGFPNSNFRIFPTASHNLCEVMPVHTDSIKYMANSLDTRLKNDDFFYLVSRFYPDNPDTKRLMKLPI